VDNVILNKLVHIMKEKNGINNQTTVAHQMEQGHNTGLTSRRDEHTIHKEAACIVRKPWTLQKHLEA
jgi:hypothetical protein